MLTLRRAWFLVGFIGIEILLLLTFILVPRFSSFIYEDLLAHCICYFVVSLWFLLPFQNGAQRYQVLLCLLVLAWLSEFLQQYTPYHIFDWYDGVANTLGIVAATKLSKQSFFERLSLKIRA